MKVNTFIDYLDTLIQTFNTNIQNKAVYMNVEHRSCYSINPGATVFTRNQPHEILCVQAFLNDNAKQPYFLDLRFRPDPDQYVPEPFEIIELKFNKEHLQKDIENKKVTVQRMTVGENINSLRLVCKEKKDNEKIVYIGIESDYIEPVFEAVQYRK